MSVCKISKKRSKEIVSIIDCTRNNNIKRYLYVFSNILKYTQIYLDNQNTPLFIVIYVRKDVNIVVKRRMPGEKRLKVVNYYTV
jgi:hypothetical protein